MYDKFARWEIWHLVMLKGITRRYKWNILLTISEWNAQRLGSDAENTSQIILKFPNLELIISLQCKNIFLQYSQHTLLMERSNVKKNKQFSKALALKNEFKNVFEI